MVNEVRAQGSLIGSQLGGYEVEALIGRGAMGTVYLARDTKLNRHIALKVLLGSLARTPSIVKQFHQEAQAAAPLNHPNIVRIYSAGIEDGVPYIAMEFVDGEPLDRFLKRKGKVEWDVALHIGAQVSSALDCAHRNGIVHRDVKPSNILLDRRGGVRLTDFGIARLQSSEDASVGTVIGTPQYMSPEQVTGGEVGPSSDLFALGVTMYQMIAGEMPFRGESSMALMKSICEDEPPRLNRLIPSVPDDVARLVAYLSAKEPMGRPASAKVAYGLIHRLQKQRGVATSVADSLTSFLKEEMEARPFSSLKRKEAETRRSHRRVKRQQGPVSRTLRLAPHVLAIALLAAGAYALGPLAARRVRAAPPDPARTLELAGVQAISGDVQRVSLYLDGFEVSDLAWGGGDAVIVRVRGQRGRLTDGSAGVLVIHPETGRVSSAVPPYSPEQEAEWVAARVFSTGLPSGRIPTASSFHESIPILAAGDRTASVVLLAQHITAAAPEPAILFETTAAEIETEPASAIDNAIALHPAGDRVCLLLTHAEEGYRYLVEREIAALPLTLTGPRRTTPSSDIVPGSLQYTPDGSRIGYLQRTSDEGHQLRMLNTGGSELNGQLVLSGIASATVAYRPDGTMAVVTLASAQGPPRVSLIDTRSGSVIARFGAGALSNQAWLADGSAFVYVGVNTDQAAGAAPQVIRVSANPPYDQTVMANIPEGVGPAYAVAPGGETVAAEVMGGRNAGVYLINAPIRSDAS